MDNLYFGFDAQISHTIAMIKSSASRYRLGDELELAKGAFFSIDPQGRLKGYCSCGGKTLLSLEYAVQSPTNWIALHLSVGGVDFFDAAILGIVCKSRSPEAVTLRACLRSQTSSGYTDAFLPKTIVAYSEISSHLDFLHLPARKDVPENADWRELVIFFPTKATAIDLIDLRVFIV